MAMSSHALFFAVKPDAAAAAQLLALGRRLREQHRLTGRLFDAARLHVTLHFFGRFSTWDEALVERLSQAGDQVRADPFAVRFDHVGSFRRPSNAPLVMRMGDDGSPGIKSLHGRLAEALAGVGCEAALQPRFVPHVTLLYDDKSLPDHDVHPVEWRVESFELVHSESGKGHRLLRQWPLHGG
jgi:RNA 2',3'-cyclic 3'-phosphodiesterase